jgi:hypothetical protein
VEIRSGNYNVTKQEIEWEPWNKETILVYFEDNKPSEICISEVQLVIDQDFHEPTEEYPRGYFSIGNYYWEFKNLYPDPYESPRLKKTKNDQNISIDVDTDKAKSYEESVKKIKQDLQKLSIRGIIFNDGTYLDLNTLE